MDNVPIPINPGAETLALLRMAEIQRSILDLPMDISIGTRGTSGYEKQLAMRQLKIRYLMAMVITKLNIASSRVIAGVSDKDLKSWRNADSHFKAAELSLYEDVLDLAEEKLHAAVAEGDLKAVQFILRTKGRSRGYTEKLEVDHGVQDFEKALMEGRARAFANKKLKEDNDEETSGQGIPDGRQGGNPSNGGDGNDPEEEG